METATEVESNNLNKNKVHHILAHSYLVYFLLFLIGVCFDLIFKFNFFVNPVVMPVGAVFILFGSLLAVWAQKAARDFKKDVEGAKNFFHGPYKYVRHPTHWGLFFLVLGFGTLTNATFVILSTIVSFLVSRFIFLEKQEAVLAEKYGAPYLEYKKSVKL